MQTQQLKIEKYFSICRNFLLTLGVRLLYNDYRRERN
nr:MAG TPA: hypothetical protein [Caudoviricetes sp.]